MNQTTSSEVLDLCVASPSRKTPRSSFLFKAFSFLFLFTLAFSSCDQEELPVRINGKVIHAITGEAMPEVGVKVENIRCSEFTPAVCGHLRMNETTNSEGEFGFSFFQECDSEIYIEMPKSDTEKKHQEYFYNNISGTALDLTCNNRPRILGDEGYYMEITVQPQMYVDIYAVDDPSQELTSFSFNDEQLEIIKESHFQKRFKIDIETLQGEFLFTTNYRGPTNVKEYISYDYNVNDDLVYEVRY